MSRKVEWFRRGFVAVSLWFRRRALAASISPRSTVKRAVTEVFITKTCKLNDL